MSITAIVFSRDRAAQLDLLLASLELNARGLLDPIHVLWQATDEPYEHGYRICAAAHPESGFLRETAFAAQVAALVEGAGPITFFTDDSILYKPLTPRSRSPEAWLAANEELLCFSLRLGGNCDSCYPLARPQRLPDFEALDPETFAWTWRGADGDFGYPGSLDGHVFRRETVLELVAEGGFSNPNTLEGLFAARLADNPRGSIGSYRESHLVGIPVNRVNETHPNRFGERWPYGPSVLNQRYLAGERLDPAPLEAETITAAHAELPLRWRPPRTPGFPFTRVVVWGGRTDLHSHGHIHRHFFRAAQALGLPAFWVDDEPAARGLLEPGTLVIAADIWANHIAPAAPHVSYVLHNFDGSHPLCRDLENAPERLLRLQVWSNDALGEPWDIARSYFREGRTLFQPWGTDLLADEFLAPVANLEARDAVFVGAIWSDRSDEGELGNEGAIDELRTALAARGLGFRHLTHVSDAENVDAVRSARLAPAFAGAWQVSHNYFPCRVFKNVSYGQVAITNVPGLQELFSACGLGATTIEGMIGEALELAETDYLDLVREQQRIVSRYTYRESFGAFARALQEPV